jgi:hypothetical protein
MYRRTARFNRKNTPTSGKPPYIVFNPHSEGEQVANVLPTNEEGKRWVQIAAIDPGIKNCAIRIERRTYTITGEGGPTPEVFRLVPDTIETIVQTKFDFLTPPFESSKKAIEAVPGSADTGYYRYSTEYLSTLVPHFSACQYILIESQMPINTEMVRMSQHLITFISLSVRDVGVRPLIIEIDPKLKSSIFKAPKMEKAALKKWAGNKAIEILKENGDVDTATFIEAAGKKDDHGDVVCYTSVWFKILADGVHRPF